MKILAMIMFFTLAVLCLMLAFYSASVDGGVGFGFLSLASGVALANVYCRKE